MEGGIQSCRQKIRGQGALAVSRCRPFIPYRSEGAKSESPGWRDARASRNPGSSPLTQAALKERHLLAPCDARYSTGSVPPLQGESALRMLPRITRGVAALILGCHLPLLRSGPRVVRGRVASHILRYRSRGLSYGAIADRMNASKHRPRGKAWGKRTVWAICQRMT